MDNLSSSLSSVLLCFGCLTDLTLPGPRTFVSPDGEVTVDSTLEFDFVFNIVYYACDI